MKLLFVCQYFYPEQFRINEVCFALAKQGHELTVLTGLPNYPSGTVFDGYNWSELQQQNEDVPTSYDKSLGAFVEHIKGVRIIRCKLRPRLTGTKNLALNYLSFVKNGNAVAKKLGRVETFDKVIVFQYSPVTMIWPALAYLKAAGYRVPLYVYSFDLWPESLVSAGISNKGIVYSVIKALSKYLYSKADCIWTSSLNFENYFRDKLSLRNPIEYLPIFSESLFLRELPSEVETYSKDKVFHFLFAGNIGEMQSVETIVKSCARLAEINAPVVFDIVGSGSSFHKVTELAHSLNLTKKQIVFHGQHQLSDMPDFYEKADAFLVTLKKDDFISYTLPGKMQGYMAYGKPIIAAIDGEASHVIRECRCGLVCGAENDLELSNIVLKFISMSSSDHMLMSQNAREYYDAHFSETAFFEKLSTLMG